MLLVPDDSERLVGAFSPEGSDQFDSDVSIPSSIVIKLTASLPATTGACNPATAGTLFPFTATATAGGLTDGLLAWGTTLEPAATAGTFATVNVPFIQGSLGAAQATVGGTDELSSMVNVCNLIQADGSGFGICGGCQIGALGGVKK